MLSPLQKCGSEGCLLDCDFLPWHRSNLRKQHQSCEDPEPRNVCEKQEKPSTPSIRLDDTEVVNCLQLPLQDPGGVWRSRSEGRLDQQGAPCQKGTEEGDKTGSGWSLPSPKSLRKEQQLCEKSLASSVESDIGSDCDGSHQNAQQKQKRPRSGISNVNPPDTEDISDDSFHHTVLYLRMRQSQSTKEEQKELPKVVELRKSGPPVAKEEERLGEIAFCPDSLQSVVERKPRAHRASRQKVESPDNDKQIDGEKESALRKLD
ncbi:hypothetical protein E2320_014560, partial [Naja naja]